VARLGVRNPSELGCFFSVLSQSLDILEEFSMTSAESSDAFPLGFHFQDLFKLRKLAPKPELAVTLDVPNYGIHGTLSTCT